MCIFDKKLFFERKIGRAVKIISKSEFRGDPAKRPSIGELDVLYCLMNGSSNSQIASKLFVSTSTVKARLNSLSQKWGVSGRSAILLYAHKNGYLKDRFYPSG
nr:LuxR C-terminal-related transcriptional regulator [Dermatophilus congolensis]